MDYGEPITAGDAVRHASEMAEAKARIIRDQVREMVARADALEALAFDLRSDADRWDKYQPEASDIGGDPP